MAEHGEVEVEYQEDETGNEMATRTSGNWLSSAKDNVAKWFTNLSLTAVGETIWSIAPYAASLGTWIMPVAPISGAAIAVIPAAAGLAISGLGVKRASGEEKAVWGLSHAAAAAGPVLEMAGYAVNPGLKTIGTAISFLSTLWSMRKRR